ncbi:MAG: hypothetical protein AAFR97_07170 [Bacteroidota bacterium]
MTTDRFDYTDYLLTHEYHELPIAVQGQVEESDYLLAQAQAKRLHAQTTTESLPAALQQAYRERLAANATSRTRRAYTIWWGMAAAILLLLTGWGVGKYSAVPKDELIYAVSSNPIPEPEIILKHDTIRQVEYRTVVRYDTVRLEVPVPTPEPLLVYDTVRIYEEGPVHIPVAGSSSMEGRERLLDLLVSAR